MTHAEKALEYFSTVRNCTQSVALSFAEDTEADEKTLCAIAGGLGGGCSCGEICGALTGAIMALGLYHPFTPETGMEAKQNLKRLSNIAIDAFHNEFGCIHCRDLLEQAGGHGRCPEFVAFAAKTVDKINSEEEKNANL